MEVLREIEVSGKKVVIYRGKGKHLINAQMKSNTPGEVLWALITEVVEVDGKKVTMEDIYEMDLGEVLQIQSAFVEAYGNFFSPQQNQSSGFQNTQDGELVKSKK